MKKLNLLFALYFAVLTFAQAQVPPQGFNYSAVARNAGGQPIANSTIGIQISILKNSALGQVMYTENHFVNTDAFGLFNLVVGAGAVQSGSMNAIDWSNDNYYLKVDMDANGGTNFLTMGTTQLLSVPYALHAATADSIIGGNVGFSGNYNDLTNLPNLSNINTDNQQLAVSATGDTLKLQNGGFVIIPGISAANTPPQLATLTTNSVSTITSTTAISGGEITNNGGVTITARGIVWSTNQNPTLSNNIGSTINGTGTGSFSSNLTGLTANTIYYIRAYATNSVGTAYGNEISFTTISNVIIISNPGAGVTFDGYTYPTIVLGNGQEWMAENLRTTKYSDGTSIPLVTDGIQWATNINNGITLPMMCWNNNDQLTFSTNGFGGLYNWFAINTTTNGSKNICPSGWHVPSISEWDTLIKYLDPFYYIDPMGGGSSNSDVAGGHMKSLGTQYWSSPNILATNDSGFSGLPGGYRDIDGTFYDDRWIAYWWTSTPNNGQNIAYIYNVTSGAGAITQGFADKPIGASVRCIKD